VTLQDLQPDATVRGILPDALGTVVSVEWHGSDALTNETLYSLNKPDDLILALVEFQDGGTHEVHYLRRPFGRSGVTTDFNGASADFPFAELLARAGEPS
jgi:hypothetical protein